MAKMAVSGLAPVTQGEVKNVSQLASGLVGYVLPFRSPKRMPPERIQQPCDIEPSFLGGSQCRFTPPTNREHPCPRFRPPQPARPTSITNFFSIASTAACARPPAPPMWRPADENDSPAPTRLIFDCGPSPMDGWT